MAVAAPVDLFASFKPVLLTVVRADVLLLASAAAAAFLASIEPPVQELFVVLTLVWSKIGMVSVMRLADEEDDPGC